MSTFFADKLYFLRLFITVHGRELQQKKKNGIDFAISLEEAKANLAASTSENYSIPLKITPATKTINDIGTEAFPYVISSFTTKYDPTNTNRSGNDILCLMIFYYFHEMIIHQSHLAIFLFIVLHATLHYEIEPSELLNLTHTTGLFLFLFYLNVLTI